MYAVIMHWLDRLRAGTHTIDEMLSELDVRGFMQVQSFDAVGDKLVALLHRQLKAPGLSDNPVLRSLCSSPNLQVRVDLDGGRHLLAHTVWEETVYNHRVNWPRSLEAYVVDADGSVLRSQVPLPKLRRVLADESAMKASVTAALRDFTAEECPICMERRPVDVMYLTECGHAFCMDCVAKAAVAGCGTRCFMCRAPLNLGL